MTNRIGARFKNAMLEFDIFKSEGTLSVNNGLKFTLLFTQNYCMNLEGL